MAEETLRIEVRQLNLFYGQVQALRNINLQVMSGLVTALVGPSGCGKSSFLRTINRMNDMIPGARVEGQVLLDGVDVYGTMDVASLRKRVGMVFQKPNPFPRSIFENVAYGPRIHGQKNPAELRDLVEQSLRQAALWDEVKDKLHRSAYILSGGQQQRLCIARALAVGPEILLMDEPASALDPIATARIEELVHQLKSQYTIVIVTHNLQQASRVSQHAAFFLAGELVEAGTTSDLFTAPKDRRTEDYLTGRFG